MTEPEKHIDIWIKQLLETGSLNERQNMYFVLEDNNEQKITVACNSKLFETIVYAFQDALSKMYQLFPEAPDESGEPISVAVCRHSSPSPSSPERLFVASILSFRPSLSPRFLSRLL